MLRILKHRLLEPKRSCVFCEGKHTSESGARLCYVKFVEFMPTSALLAAGVDLKEITQIKEMKKIIEGNIPTADTKKSEGGGEE